MTRSIKLVFLTVFAITAASANTITVLPSSQNVGLGNQASVSLTIAGLGNGTAPSVGAYDIDVMFDPTVLSFNSAIFGNQLDILGLGDLQFVTPGAGDVDLFELSLDSASDLNNLQAASFILATLTFDTIGTGTSPITLTLNALGDADGKALAADLVNGSVTVSQQGGPSPVPEPSSLVLIVGAAPLLIGLYHRRKRSLKI
jgi:hypothetical protein